MTEHREQEAASVSGLREAVARARGELAATLSIPAGVDRDLAVLDATPNGPAWGRTLWRALKALDGYAHDQHSPTPTPGGLWAWCQATGEWPATSKKLALRESQTVASNTVLHATRIFPVDAALEPSGQRYMEAHMKISEGGGPLAPRLYFHDDTRGTTRKIHIGFIGPHRLVGLPRVWLTRVFRRRQPPVLIEPVHTRRV